MAQLGQRRKKDQEMARRMKDEGIVRRTGICCICYRVISNGDRAESHYDAHARGADNS